MTRTGHERWVYRLSCEVPALDGDPVVTNPDLYKVVFENDRVRVLEYRDKPGDRTTPHEHPDSVMYTVSGFRRRLYAAGGGHRDVELRAGLVAWLPAQWHSGHNTSDTDTHVIFVELKEGAPGSIEALGPTAFTSPDGIDAGETRA